MPLAIVILYRGSNIQHQGPGTKYRALSDVLRDFLRKFYYLFYIFDSHHITFQLLSKQDIQLLFKGD